ERHGSGGDEGATIDADRAPILHEHRHGGDHDVVLPEQARLQAYQGPAADEIAWQALLHDLGDEHVHEVTGGTVDRPHVSSDALEQVPPGNGERFQVRSAHRELAPPVP